MEKIIRFGLVGPGDIAEKKLAPALAKTPGAALWSVMSRDLGRAASFAQRHGARSPEPAHSSLDAMLADPGLDAVIIATPDRLHASQAIAAARAGKHVLTEKPMATSVEDALAMVAAADAADVRMGVAYHHRWHDGHRRLAKRIAEGVLGTLRHLRIEWSVPAEDGSTWRASDEVGRWWSMAALGTHCVDLARWFMVPSCGETRAVRGLFTNGRFRTRHDETSLLSIRFASGATASILASVALPPVRVIELHGDKASARCEWTLGGRGEGTMTLGGEKFPFDIRDPYVGELADFVAAVRDGRRPEVDGEEGARNVALLVAAEESNGW